MQLAKPFSGNDFVDLFIYFVASTAAANSARRVAEILCATLTGTFSSCRFLYNTPAAKQVLYSSLMSIFTIGIPFLLLSRYWERRKWEKEKQSFRDNGKMPFGFQRKARDVKQPFVLAKSTQPISWLFAELATCFACFVQISWAYFKT